MNTYSNISRVSESVGILLFLQNPTHGIRVGFVGFPYREPYNPTPPIFRHQKEWRSA